LDFIPVNQVSNVEELDMEVMCTLSRVCFTILFQSHRAGIVFNDNVDNFPTLKEMKQWDKYTIPKLQRCEVDGMQGSVVH
jgi:hypothetical protein